MKINRDDLKWFISNVKRNYPDCSEEEFANHLASYMETNPACVDMNGVSNPGRFSYSTVGYGVFSLFGEKYRMGRIEVFDRENESGYAVHEGAYSIPHVAASQFEDFIESLETDLPIHIEIGSHNWCADECAKSLGFENDEEMSNPDNVKAYRRNKNDEYAREQGYKDFDDLLANSKFAKKCEYSGLPSVDSYDSGSIDKEQQAKLISEVMQADERDGLYDEPEDKTFKQKSKWQSIDSTFNPNDKL